MDRKQIYTSNESESSGILFCQFCVNILTACNIQSPDMSYYRYITGVYKSYWPELNRTLRSSSSPRHIPEPVPCKYGSAGGVSQAPSLTSPHFRSYRAGHLPPSSRVLRKLLLCWKSHCQAFQ